MIFALSYFIAKRDPRIYLPIFALMVAALALVGFGVDPLGPTPRPQDVVVYGAAALVSLRFWRSRIPSDRKG